jgi:hypothetical protein
MKQKFMPTHSPAVNVNLNECGQLSHHGCASKAAVRKVRTENAIMRVAHQKANGSWLGAAFNALMALTLSPNDTPQA